MRPISKVLASSAEAYRQRDRVDQRKLALDAAQPPSGRFLAQAIACTCALMCGTATAQVIPRPPLPLPLHLLEVTVHGEKSSDNGSDVFGRVQHSDTFSGAFGASQFGSATATSAGAGIERRKSPVVIANGFSKATGGGPDSQGYYYATSGEVRARGFLFYSTRIAELDAPPFVIPPNSFPLKLPVTVTVLGEGEATVSQSASGPPWSGAWGYAAAVVAGVPTGKVEVCDGQLCGSGISPTARFNESFDFSFVAGQEIGVILEVFASAGAKAGGEVGNGEAFVRINIDPVFSFNQPAFDEIARAGGFPTFDLSRYFAFEYSAGAAPVPEPATGLLFLGGLAVVLALRRRSLQRLAHERAESVSRRSNRG